MMLAMEARLVSVGKTDALHKACKTQNVKQSPGEMADSRARKGIYEMNLQHLGVPESKEGILKSPW